MSSPYTEAKFRCPYTSVLPQYFSNVFLAASNVSEKHKEEIAVGHVFPEEEAAFALLNFVSWLMPTIVAVSSLFDFALVFLFQNCLHPWRRIFAKVRKYFALGHDVFRER